MSSIFLSHSSGDMDAARRLAGRLRSCGFTTLFLDCDPEDGIKAGQLWERELYRKLKLSGAVVVLCSPASMGSKWCFAEVTQAKALGKTVLPLVIEPCQVEGVLIDRQIVDQTRLGEDEAFAHILEGLRAAGLDPDDSFTFDVAKRPPYPGMLAFEQDDAGVFFGRRDETREAIESLVRLQQPGEPRLLVIVGSSGSGKSSLVRAGVLPRLNKDPGRWVIVPPFRPQSDPVAELARAWAEANGERVTGADWRALLDRLRREARAPSEHRCVLAEMADEITMSVGRREAKVLLVIDQAEELLVGHGAASAADFFALLLPALESPGSRLFALLTLRSDFLGGFQNHPSLRGVPFRAMTLGPMPSSRFAELIEGPAARAEIAVEPALVATMVQESEKPDALPLLAFTLRELWERCNRSAPAFALATYRDEFQGLDGAVRRAVERLKPVGNWAPEVETGLRRAFLKLARVSDDGRFSRQRARWADLPAEAVPVLERLIQARLLTADNGSVEVAHEAIFRVWDDLKRWLDEDRELLFWRRNIHYGVMAWERAPKEQTSGHLLSGARVVEARRWLESHPEAFDTVELSFLRASIAEADRIIEQERERERQLQTAKDQAEARERVAQSLRRAAQSQVVAKKDPVASLLLSIEALHATRGERPPSQAFQALFDLLNTMGGRAVGHGSFVQCLSFAPDGRLVTGGRDGVARVWDLKSPQAAPMELRGHTPWVLALAFAPDGRLVTSSLHEVNVWDLDHPQACLVKLPFRVTRILAMSFSPDGRLAACGDDGVARVWDLGHPHDAPLELQGGKDRLKTLAFAPEGKLVLGGENGVLRVWDPHDVQSAPLELHGHTGNINTLGFAPDGRLVTAGGDGVVRVWDLADTGAAPDELQGHLGEIHAIAFAPDGRLATGGYDAVLRVWDLKAGKKATELRGHVGAIRSLAFAPDGRLISGGDDGVVWVWDPLWVRFKPDDPREVMGYMRSLELRGQKGKIAALVIGPTGVPATCGEDGVARVWEPWTIPCELPGKQDTIERLVFAPDGRLMTVGSGETWVWDLKDRRNAAFRIRSHDGKLTTIGFAPDGRLVTVCDGIVWVWDLKQPRMPPLQLRGRANAIDALAFGPDGWVAAGGCDEVVWVWNLGDPEHSPLEIRGNEGSVNALGFAPDGRLVACDEYGGGVVWDPRSPQSAPLQFRGELFSNFALAFAPDGRLLTGGARLRIWDLDKLEQVPVEIGGHEAWIRAMALVPDGRLVTGDEHGVARVWDLSDIASDPIVLRARAKTAIQALQVSADGRTLAAGLKDGRLLLWSLQVEDLTVEAAQVAGRNFARAEWRRYFGAEPYRRTFAELPEGQDESWYRRTFAELPEGQDES